MPEAISPQSSNPTPTEEIKNPNVKERLLSLDAFRGIIMVTLVCGGFGLRSAARGHLKTDPDSGFWQLVNYHSSHTQWSGCSVWDIIMPCFMFMVGMGMAYSSTRRSQEGQSFRDLLKHAIKRSLILIVLGFILDDLARGYIYVSLSNVLIQMGLGYTFLFLISLRPFKSQVKIACALLILTWAAFELYPGAGIDFDSPDLSEEKRAWATEHLKGIRGPWHEGANLSTPINKFLVDWVPEGAFKNGIKVHVKYGPHSYIQFVTAIVTMLFGLWSGLLMKSKRSKKEKLKLLLISGCALMAVGAFLDVTGLCPIIKKLWSPSFTLYVGGISVLILASLFWVIDIMRFKWWVYPFACMGMNSLLMYCLEMLHFGSYIRQTLKLYFSGNLFSLYGLIESPNSAISSATIIAAVFLLISVWLYRQKIFIKI